MPTLKLSEGILKYSKRQSAISWSNASAAIICRMSSTRLPGKTLANVRGKALVQYIIDALRENVPPLKLALVTSADKTDDAIESYGRLQGLKVVRGPLEDVASRFAKAIAELDSSAVFRVNGDSPLVPVGLFQTALDAMFTGKWDLVTNINPRTFPLGMSIELIRTKTYMSFQPSLIDASEREHVTLHFYNHPKRFRILNLALPYNYSMWSMAVDTPADLRLFERMLESMGRPYWTYSVHELVTLRRNLVGEQIIH